MLLATQPVETPGSSSERPSTGQDSSLSVDVDRPKVQPPGHTAQNATFMKKSVTSLTGSIAPVEEPAAESEHFSDWASSYADEGEISDL